MYPNTSGCFSHLNNKVITPADMSIKARSEIKSGKCDIYTIWINQLANKNNIFSDFIRYKQCFFLTLLEINKNIYLFT